MTGLINYKAVTGLVISIMTSGDLVCYSDSGSGNGLIWGDYQDFAN